MPDRIVAFIVNFNRRELLLRTIASVQAQTRAPDEILVIDNGSTDDSIAAVRTEHGERVRVLALGENFGSSGGFHHGVAASLAAGATQVLILDSDVTLAADCVARLSAALTRDPQAGVVGPKVYHWDSASVLQELGGWIDWTTADLRRSHWRHDEAVGGVITRDQPVDYVPACCLLATRDAIAAAGNFDPGWFLYWDDVDWCDRVRAAGWGVQVIAAARVQHFGGGANKHNLVPVYYGWRNRLVFFRRRTPETRREETLRAFYDDFLLARFTCRAFGLVKTAAMMECAVDDARRGIFDRKNFAGWDVTLDPPVPLAATESGANMAPVHHVIGSASAELADRPGLVLRDRFGKCLPAARAWELHQAWAATREQELRALLAPAE